jgi:hypothetical protein
LRRPFPARAAIQGTRKEVFYVLEVIRGRFPFEKLKRTVIEVKRRYGSSPTF